jgi:excisionase family DNA binding protein
VKQAADRLRVCTATVYKLCAAGALGHVRVQNAIRFRPEQLEQYVRSSERTRHHSPARRSR